MDMEISLRETRVQTTALPRSLTFTFAEEIRALKDTSARPVPTLAEKLA
jgi:hypothetical protein